MMSVMTLSALGTVDRLAASITWNGGGADNNWSSAANWSGATPIELDSLTFGGASRLSNINDWLVSIGAVNFTTGGFNISGNALTLNGNFDSTGSNTWAINSTLGAARTFTSHSGTLTLSGSITNGIFLTTIAGAGDTVISGVLGGGSGGLAKTGTGTLTLTNANTYTGATTIAPGGTLSVSQDANLGSVPGATTASSLVIDNGILSTTATFTLNAKRGMAVGTFSGSGAGTIDVASGTILTYGGIITSSGAGTGGLTKAGAGTLLLSGANTYTGITTISAGTLKLGAASALPSGPGTLNLVVNATLDLNGNSTTVNGLSGTTGTVTSGVAGSTTFSAGGNNGSDSYSGVIQNGSGTLGFTKIGIGTITLGGNNTFTGGVTINGGILQLANAGALNSAAPNSLIFGPNAPVGTSLGTKLQLGGNSVTVSSLATNATPGTVVLENASVSAATLTISQSTSTSFAGVIQNGSGGGTLGLTKSGTGTLTLSGENTFTGTLSISQGTLSVGSVSTTVGGLGSAASAVILGDATNTGTLGYTGTGETLARGFTLNAGGGAIDMAAAGGTLTLNTVGITGSGAFTKIGTGTLTLAVASSYSGTTSIKNGNLTLGLLNALPTGTALTLGDGTSNASGVLQLNGFSQTLTGLTKAGTGTSNRVINGSLTAATLTLNTASDSSFSGLLGLSGGTANENNFALTKVGAGILTLTGVNTYSGATTVNGGTLKAGANGAFGTGSALTLANTLGVSLDITGFDTVIGSLAGGGINGGNVSLGANNLSVGDATSTAYAGIIAGTGALIKTGAGTLTLSGSNTYQGATSVKNGTLALSVGDNRLLASAAVTLGDASANTGGILQLNGVSQTLTGITALGSGTNRVIGGSATASALILDLAGTSSFSGILGNSSGTNVNNFSLTKTGSGTLTLSGANLYSGTTTLSAGVVKYGVATAIPSGTGKGDIVVNGTLDINGLAPTLNGLTGSGVITNTGSTAKNLTIGGNDAAGDFSGTIQNGSGTNTLGLVKTGTNILKLSGNNTFTNGLTIGVTSGASAGIVQLGSLGALNAAGTNTVTFAANVAAGTKLQLNGYSITVAGLVTNATVGTPVVENASDSAATLTVNNTATVTYAGVLADGSGTNINGAFSLTKAGSGTFTLSGSSTYTGVTTVSGGILSISADANLGNAGAIVINGGTLQATTTFTLGSGRGIALGLTSGASGIIDVGGALGANKILSYDGIIADNAESNILIKSGLGSLTLGGTSSSFSGGTTLNAGSICVTATAVGTPLGTGAIAVNAGGNLSLSSTNNKAGGQTLTITSLSGALGGVGFSDAGLAQSDLAGMITTDSTSTYGGVLSINNGITYANTLTLATFGTAAGKALWFLGSATTGAYSNTVLTASSGTYRLGGGGGTLTLSAANVLTGAANVIIGSTSANGNGVIVLSNDQNYSGTTTITNGTLRISSLSALGTAGGQVTLGSTTTTKGTLDYTGADTDYVRGFIVNKGGGEIDAAAGSTLTIKTGAITINSTGTFTLGGAGNATLSSTITGASGGILTKAGTGTLTLTATQASSYSGTTNITGGGILNFSNIGNLGTGTINLSNGSTLQYASNNAADITKTPANVMRAVVLGTGGGIIDTNGNDIAYAYPVTGTTGLTKAGAGTLMLSGGSGFTGGLAINAGTIKLGSANAIGTTNSVTFGSGADSATKLQLNGNNLAIANLSSANGLPVVENSSSSTAATLTVTQGTALTYSGVIQDGLLADGQTRAGQLSLIKAGTQNLTLTGTNDYSGTTTVTLGILTVSSDSNLGKIPGAATAGSIVISGGALSAAASFTLDTNRGLALGATGTLDVTGANVLTYNGLVANNGATTGNLTKTGTGTLLIHNASAASYTGATNVQNGTLKLGGGGGTTLPATTVMTLGTGTTSAKLVLGDGDDDNDDQTLAGLLVSGTGATNTVAGGNANRTSALTLNIAVLNSYGGILGGATATEKNLSLIKTGAGNLILSGTNTYTGGTTISNGTVSIGADPNLGSAPAVTTAGSIVLSGGTLSASAAMTLDSKRGIAVVGTGTLDLAAGKTLTYNGIIANGSGSGGLTKTNTTGMLLLGGANTYSGDTTISGGTLQLGIATAIPSGTGKGNFALNGTSTLDLNGKSPTVNGLSGTGTITSTAIGNLTLTAGDNNGSGSFSGLIQNGSATSLALTKIGSGALTLGGINANTYTGNTTITAGTLQIANNAAIPSGTGKGDVVVNGTLDLNDYDATVNGLSGAGLITNTLGASILTAGTANKNGTFTGSIQDGAGTVGLVKTGTGTLTLSGHDNTFSGLTTISKGTVTMGTSTGLSSHSVLTIDNAGTLDINGKSIVIDGLAGTGTINNNATGAVTLTTGSSGGSGVFGGALNNGSGVIALIKAGSGTQTLTAANGYSGGTTITGGMLAITADNNLGAIPGTTTPANLVLNGGALSASNSFELNSKRGIAVGPAAGSGGGILDAALNQTLTYNGVLANNGSGSGGLAKTGSGTVTLGGVNTYTGDTSIAAGALQIGNALAIPAGSGMGNVLVNATLDLNNTSITVNGLSGSGLVSNTKTGAATLSAGTNDQTSAFDGVIANGNGTTALAKVGTGTLTLTGSSSYTGGTTVATGTLSISADGNLGAAPNTISPANVALNAGATLAATSSFTLNANRGIALGASGAGLIEVAASSTLTYGGAIANSSGNGGFTKTGAGALVLSGTSSYTGTTTVATGILTVNGSIASSGSTVVHSGATLTGTGTTGVMTVNASGTVSPGNSGIGALAAAGGLGLAGNAAFELGTPGASHAAPGTSDRMDVTGGIALGGNLNLSNNAGANDQGSLGAGSYKLFTYTDSASGGFASVTGLPSYHWALHDVVVDKAIYIDVYNYAVATITPAVDLGRIHAGGSFGTQALTVENTTAAGNFTEALAGAFGSTASGITTTGSVTGIAGQAANSSSMVVGISDNSAGQKAGVLGVDFTSQIVSGSGLTDTALARQNVAVSGFAYSGQSVWNVSGSGSWGNNVTDYGNWTHSGGVAGLDGILSANDTTTFGSATATPSTVSLNGANPTLRAITFDHSQSYTLAQGSGGQVTLQGNGGAATVTDASGSHTLAAPVVLASNAEVAVTHAADTLTISGTIAGTATGLTKSGEGTLTLTGHSGYTGATVVSAGTLLVNGSLGNSATTIASGATLCGTGTLGGGVTVNGTLAPGAVDSIGTIGVDSLYLAHTLRIEWNGDTQAIDLVNITHQLQLGESSTIVFTGMAGGLTQPAYVFATYESLTGPVTRFNTITDLPTGYDIDYTFGAQGNQLALVAIPETRAALLGGLGLLLLLKRRRNPRAAR